MEREDMDNIVAASEWKGYWESLIDENIALRARVARLEELVQCLLDEDPNEQIAESGLTVLCAWRHDARRALEEK